MDTWRNGDSGKVVKNIIDNNFKKLDNRIKQSVETYARNFVSSEWSSGIITIPFSEHNKKNPYVELYIKTKNGYSPVLNGYEIKDNGIELKSDIAYEGRVVIR